MQHTEQPLALRLADALEKDTEGIWEWAGTGYRHKGIRTKPLSEKAATELRRQHAEIRQWTSVFGHLGTADECGNEWIKLQEANEALRVALKNIANIEDKMYGGDWDEINEARDIANAALAQGEKA